MKKVGYIYESDDYDIFCQLQDNRDVLASRLNKLVASISQKYVLNPIIVNEKYEIIDGQGRYEALKALGLPVYFIIADGATSEDCRRMNKYNTKWTALDFAKSYAKAGKEAYIYLLEACKKTGMPIQKVLRATGHNSRGDSRKGSVMTPVEAGTLDFSFEDIEKAEIVTRYMNEICEALQFNSRTNDAFLAGVTIMSNFPGYNHERMLTNCKKLRGTYQQMSRMQDQLVEFERIYNHNYSPKNRLYFSDYMRNKGYNVRTYNTDQFYSKYREKDISTLKKGGM